MIRIRLRVRTLMVAVAIVALLLAAVAMTWRTYRCWVTLKSLAATNHALARYGFMNGEAFQKASEDRDLIVSCLVHEKDFADLNLADREAVISTEVKSTQAMGASYRLEATRLEEMAKSQDLEAARCWNPFASIAH